MAFPTRLLVEGEELVFDLRPHWIALVMPAIATVATLAVMLVLYDTFDEPILDMVVGIAGTLFLLAYPGAQAGRLAHVAFRRDERPHHPSARLHREVLDGGAPRGDQRRPLRAGGHRSDHRRRDARGAVGVGGRPAGVRPHPQARGGPEDDLPPGRAESAADDERERRRRSSHSATSELERLADLRARGVLTEEEFQAQKRRILG